MPQVTCFPPIRRQETGLSGDDVIVGREPGGPDTCYEFFEQVRYSYSGSLDRMLISTWT